MVSHVNFFNPFVSYQNEGGSTFIKREPFEAPRPTTGKPMYSSRKEMLLDELRRRGEGATLEQVSYSDMPRADFQARIEVSGKLLGITKCLNFTNHYFKNSPLNGRTFADTDGKVLKVAGAITPSGDDSSSHLMMARVLENEHGAISYAGRPDTREKAIQQAEDIFRTEQKHGKLLPQKDGSYELTYVVDSLTNGGTIQFPGMPNERKEICKESEALNSLRGKVIDVDGCKVRLQPIHVHHMLSLWSRFSPILPDKVSGIELEKEINSLGYSSLKDVAIRRKSQFDSVSQQLIDDTILQLDNPDLLIHERLILVDFLSRISRLPIVHHCHSIIDRTSVATAIATINDLIAHKDIPLSRIPKDKSGKYAIHLLCREEEYKKLFIMALNIQHQVSKDAWTGIGPEGEMIGRKVLGLNYSASMLGAIPSALALLPSSAIEQVGWERHLWLTLYTSLFILSIVTLIYHTAILILGLCTQDADFALQMAVLPFQINWLRFGDIDISRTFNLESQEINGDERALILGAKTTHTLTKEILTSTV